MKTSGAAPRSHFIDLGGQARLDPKLRAERQVAEEKKQDELLAKTPLPVGIGRYLDKTV
jgi:hypothetical protein